MQILEGGWPIQNPDAQQDLFGEGIAGENDRENERRREREITAERGAVAPHHSIAPSPLQVLREGGGTGRRVGLEGVKEHWT